MSTAPLHDDEAALRAEHDGLSSKLTSRRSIDAMRRGLYATFALAIASGLSAKLAYDRWGPYHPRAFKSPPIFFYLALAAALTCFAVAGLSFTRARRQMRVEDADFARLRDLRQRLGLDP
jgi:hypothetical protein